MNNTTYEKAMENLINRINVRLVNNKKILFKMYIKKPSYMSYKLFENNFVAKRKSKLALKLNKPAYIGMCILELNKVIMY